MMVSCVYYVAYEVLSSLQIPGRFAIDISLRRKFNDGESALGATKPQRENFAAERSVVSQLNYQTDENLPVFPSRRSPPLPGGGGRRGERSALVKLNIRPASPPPKKRYRDQRYIGAYPFL